MEEDRKYEEEKKLKIYGRAAHNSKIKRKRELQRMMILSVAAGFVILLTGGIAISNSMDHNSKADAQEAKEKDKKAKSIEVDKKEGEAQRIERVKSEALNIGCPQELIALIDKNMETVELVENYNEKKDAVPPETLKEELVAGQIPLLIQWDGRWGYAPYGTSTVAASGCGPTCMAMVIAGLTGDKTVTPFRMAKFSEENGYLDETNNTYWAFMNEAAKGWGISSRETPPDEVLAAEELAAGHPIICSVTPGDFTTSGHFIVLTGYENGVVTVNDPFSRKNSEKKWVYADIASQIKEMWIYSKEAAY